MNHHLLPHGLIANAREVTLATLDFFSGLCVDKCCVNSNHTKATETKENENKGFIKCNNKGSGC